MQVAVAVVHMLVIQTLLEQVDLVVEETVVNQPMVVQDLQTVVAVVEEEE
tara:strand:- start:383 stop:532 length:150 start_codon:yes stop_codon:yes gene_type:complete